MSEQSYLNSYRLLIGETTYEELSTEGSFLLPKNHEDPQETLDYYISIEDYEKCIKIRDKIKRYDRI
jgi:protein-arginine kinase activator protein McsA